MRRSQRRPSPHPNGQSLGRVDKTVDTKLRVAFRWSAPIDCRPRQTTTERIEVQDVERASDDLVNAAVEAGGRRLGNGEMSQDRAGHVTSQSGRRSADEQGRPDPRPARTRRFAAKQASLFRARPRRPTGRARIDATFSNSAASLGGEETTWDAIRNGLSVSGRGLRLEPANAGRRLLLRRPVDLRPLADLEAHPPQAAPARRRFPPLRNGKCASGRARLLPSRGRCDNPGSAGASPSHQFLPLRVSFAFFPSSRHVFGEKIA